MKTGKYHLSKDCWIEALEFDMGVEDVSLVYIEHATDFWGSDYEVDIPLNRADSIKLIQFLMEANSITAEDLRKE